MNDALQMLRTMVELQEAHNIQVAPDWRSRGLPFQRAIWVECAELLDHFGWKWWKRQTPDLGQVKLELVDIWHFGLSQLMQEGRTGAEEAARLAAVLTQTAAASSMALPAPADATDDATDDAEAFRASVESLALAALRTGTFAVAEFAQVMQGLRMDLRELFELYVGKNVLNRFRQDHGYLAGDYRKTWAGREDNAHLLEIVGGIDPARTDYTVALYAQLRQRYESTAAGA